MTISVGRTARRVAAAFVVGLLFQLVLPLLPYRGAQILMGGSLAVIALYTCVGHLRRARDSHGRARVGWAAAVMVSGLWSLTNACYAGYAALDLPVPHPGPHDLLAMAAICFIPPVMIILTPADGGPRVRLRRLIDGATISAALVFLSWHFVVGPIMELVPPGLRAASAVAPAIEIVSFALALVALSRSRPSDGNALILMEFALVVLSVATLADIYNVSFGLERFANGVGGAYLTSTLILALGSRSSLPSGEAPRNPGAEGPWGWLPYLPVGVSFCTAAYLQVTVGSLGPVLFWVQLSTAVLVLVRQFLNLRTNQELLRRVDEQRERVTHLAFHDPLTGLANRAMLSERAGAALAGAPPDSTTALLLVDLDGFKAVNDTYGHAAGDGLLVLVAAALTRCVRAEDLVVRLGGDEFVVFMPGLTGADEAERIGGRILRELAAPMLVEGVRMPMRGSAGLAVTRGAGTTPDTLLRDADVALYQAKAAGKNRMCLFPQSSASSDGTGSGVSLLAG